MRKNKYIDLFHTLQHAGDKARIEPKSRLYATNLLKTSYGPSGIYQRHLSCSCSHRLGCSKVQECLKGLFSCRLINLWTTSKRYWGKCYLEKFIIKSERWKVLSLRNGCWVKVVLRKREVTNACMHLPISQMRKLRHGKKTKKTHIAEEEIAPEQRLLFPGLQSVTQSWSNSLKHSWFTEDASSINK